MISGLSCWLLFQTPNTADMGCTKMSSRGYVISHATGSAARLAIFTSYEDTLLGKDLSTFLSFPFIHTRRSAGGYKFLAKIHGYIALSDTSCFC